MLAFLKKLFAALLGLVCAPFEWLFGRRGSDHAAQRQAAEADEKADRADAVSAATAPDTRLEDSLAVRRAARAVLRGEPADGVDEPVKMWLESMPKTELAFVAGAQPDALAAVLAGQRPRLCPVSPFVRSAWDGTDIRARFQADRAAARVAQAQASLDPTPAPRPLGYADSLPRRIRSRAAAAAAAASVLP